MRGRTVLGVLCAMLATAAPARADSLVLIKEPPLAELAPQARTWQTPDATIEAHGDRRSAGVTASFPDDPYTAHHSVGFQAPVGEELRPGAVYDNVVDDPYFQSARIAVSGEGATCSGGRFQVLDIAWNGEGAITRLWVVFACSLERPAQFGEVRYGMGGDLAPAHARWPASDRHNRGSEIPVTFTAPKAVTVTGVSTTGDSPDAFEITSDACSAVALGAGRRCAIKVAHRAGSAGHKLAALRFSLSDGTTRETVLDAFAFGGKTGLYLDSDDGDPIGRGDQVGYSPGDGLFLAGGDLFGIVGRGQRGDATWQLEFDPARWDVLAPGTHAGAQYGYDHEVPSMRVTRSGGSETRVCRQPIERSSFTVNDLREWPSGRTRSLSLSFVQRCNGASGELRGTLDLRTGDQTPLPPWMDQAASPPKGSASLSFFADPGDLVGHPDRVRQFVDSAAEGVAVRPYGDAGGLRAGAGSPGRRAGVQVQVEPPRGEALVPGVYDHARTDGHGDEKHPVLYVDGGMNADGFEGRFEILDLARDADGSVDRLWMVYEGGAIQGVDLRYAGEVRWGQPTRSLLPALMRLPVTHAGRAGRVVPFTFTALETTSLGAAEVVGSDTFRIRHDGCAGRTLAAGERCRVWIRPLAARAGLETATLKLPAGQTVHSSPIERFAWGGTTRVDMTSGHDDWVGGGRTFELGPDVVRLEAAAGPEWLDIGLESTLGDWLWLSVRSPVGGTLGTGTYEDAAWWPRDPERPGMAVDGNGKTCRYLEDSWFAVDELRRWPDGHVRSAVVRFEQRCEGLSPLAGTWSFRAGDETRPPHWVLVDGDNAVPAKAPPVDPDRDSVTDPDPDPTAAGSERPAHTPPPAAALEPPPATEQPTLGRGCKGRRLTINLRRRPARKAVVRINGRRIRTIGARARRLRVLLTQPGRTVLTVREGGRTLDRRVYRVTCRAA